MAVLSILCQWLLPKSAMLFSLSFTVLFISWYSAVDAGSVNKDGACNPANNRLQTGTYQFYSDCNSQTYCASNSTCQPKGCRRDDFPFGYPQDSKSIPEKCKKGQFCPDEEDACQPLLAVGSACQLNRDGNLSCNYNTTNR